MKTSLEHLPKQKQYELRKICDLIVEEMEPQMVILFGSYATGKWVEDKYVEDGITFEYKSDFDLLVISHVELGPRRINRWRRTEDAVRKLTIETPVSLIHHGIKYINKEIRRNSYFFTDILKEGIMLYNTCNYTFDKPQKLNEEQLKQKAREDFEQWYSSANDSLDVYSYTISKDLLKESAFNLHQATERYYTAFLLVFTGYRPKTHDIQKLGDTAATINEKFKTIFPLTAAEERHHFDLLKRAYVDARYKKDYTITKEELDYLSKRIVMLKELVKESCGERVK